jgi:hypothetical protein
VISEKPNEWIEESLKKSKKRLRENMEFLGDIFSLSTTDSLLQDLGKATLAYEESQELLRQKIEHLESELGHMNNL